MSAGAGTAAAPPSGCGALPGAIRVSSRSRGLFSAVKARTGLPQHVSARLAVCLSLADRTGHPDAGSYDEDGSEIRLSDAFGGACAGAYAAVIAHAMRDAGIEDAGAFMRAHANRGAVMLFSRVRSLEDVGTLFPPQADAVEGDAGGQA